MRLEHQESRPQGNPSTRPGSLHDFSNLRASERKYLRLVTNLNDVVYTVDAEGIITYISPRAKSISGYRPSELLGRSFSDFIHPEDLPALLEVWQGQRKGKTEPAECRVLVKNGQYRFFRVSGRPQFKDGQFAGVIGTITDVSERREAESALRENEKKYRALFEQSIDAVSLVTLQGRVIEANATWFQFFGYSPADLLWLDARDTYAEPGDRDILLQKIAEKGSLVDYEMRLKKKDGTVVECLCSVSVRRAADGSVVGYQTVFRDITEQKRAERALRESEERFRMVLSRSPVTMAHVNRDLRYTWIHNPHPNFDPASVRGKRDDELADNEGTRRLAQLKRQVIETGSPARATISFPVSEGERTYDIAAEPMKDDSGMVVGATTVSFDITERTRAEEALRESEEKYRELFELSRDATSLSRRDGTFIDVNQAWLDLFGFVREELPGINAYDLYEVPSERDSRLLQPLEKTGAVADLEVRFKKKDGTVMDCVSNFIARRDATGNIVAFQTVTRDITESKRARRELQDSRDKLNELHAYLVEGREAERAAIARELHDQFSQALNALRLDLSELRRRLSLGESIGPETLDRMVELVDNTSEDVRRLSSDLRPGLLDDLGLSAAVEWNVQEFASRTGLRTSLQLNADDSNIAASCATTLFRILQELLSNIARHAQASALSVSLRNSDDSLVLTVTDDGRGITEEELASKESLGIISIRERVNLFRGTVDISGESGKGTTVEVTIPLEPPLPE